MRARQEILYKAPFYPLRCWALPRHASLNHPRNVPRLASVEIEALESKQRSAGPSTEALEAKLAAAEAKASANDSIPVAKHRVDDFYLWHNYVLFWDFYFWSSILRVLMMGLTLPLNELSRPW